MAGCGTGNNTVGTGFGGGGTAGSFSASSLSGNYTYQISGYDLSSGAAIPFREAGVFVADGNGKITSGEDDFAEGSSILSNVMAPGTYSVSSDGTGVITLNFNNGGGLQLAMAVESAPTIYLAVNVIAPTGNGLQANGTGVALAQTTSALTAPPSGNFAFRMHNINSTQSTATVGAFTIAAGAVSSGNEDQLANNTESQLTLTSGLFNAPDSFGRGTGSLTDSNGVTTPFSYYIADTHHFYLFSSATGNIGLGQAESQSGTFSAASLSGSYAFGSRGDDAFSLGGVNTVGQFTVSSGTVSSGQLDIAQDATVTNANITGGNVTIAPTGRALVTLNLSSGNPIQEIYWMVDPTRAFLLTNDTSKVEDGTVDQQSGSFSTSSLNGQFGFAMDGFIPISLSSINLYDRVGYVHWDGAGNLALKEFVNVSGAANQPGILQGSYTVGSNGRVTGSVSTLSSNLIFYLISNNQAYMLQGDSQTEISGNMGTLP